MPSHAVCLPGLRTVSEANKREHWAAKARRAKQQRIATFRWLQHLLPRHTQAPDQLHITLTRVAPRALDDDNAQAALKAVRDGVSDYLAGHYLAGQDRQPG